jgi:hypothetical protein
MEQFSSGKVMSLLDTIAVTCVSDQMTTIGGLEPFALLSQCSLTDYLHGIFPEETRVVTQKKTFSGFFDSAPTVGLSDLIPKFLPIREVNEIFTPSYAYQRGSRDDHFLTAFLSEVIFASLGATGTKCGTTQLYV